MTLDELLRGLADRDIRLSLGEGGNLVVDAPEGAITERLRKTLTEAKPVLLRHLMPSGAPLGESVGGDVRMEPERLHITATNSTNATKSTTEHHQIAAFAAVDKGSWAAKDEFFLQSRANAFDGGETATERTQRGRLVLEERAYIDSRLSVLSCEEYGRVIAVAKHAAERGAMPQGAFVAGRYYLDPAVDVLYLLDKCAGLRGRYGDNWMKTIEGAARAAELDTIAVWWEAEESKDSDYAMPDACRYPNGSALSAIS